jgi:hypothetical protein
MPGFFVKNNSTDTIECFVSKYTNDKGSDGWYTLEAGKGDTWARGDGWELIAFKYKGDRHGVYVKTGQVVTFNWLGNVSLN